MKPDAVNTCALALATLLAACYSAPSERAPEGASILDIELDTQGTLVADGASIVALTIVVDPETPPTVPIVVEVSSGTLSPGAAPDTPEARTRTLDNQGTGRLPLSLRVGTTPGTTLVTASAGGYLVSKEIELTASPPERVVLTAGKQAITADGESGLDLDVSLFAAKPPALVSMGAAVRIEVCCPDESGAAAPCKGVEPLSIPAQTTLQTGQSIRVRAVSERIVGASAEAIAVLVRAESASSPAHARCASPLAGAVFDEISLSVLPVSP